MAKRAMQREAVLDRLADFVLAEGLGAASLRPLAAAAEVSDRMLLYYFQDKAELMQAVVERLAGRMATTLDRAVGPERRTPEGLREVLWGAAVSPELRPFMQLWLEIGAAAGRGDAAMRAVGGRIALAFQAFIASRLALEGEEAGRAAATLLALLDGAFLVESVGAAGLAALAIEA